MTDPAKPTLRPQPIAEVEVAARFRKDYRHFQYAVADFFSDHLSDVSRAFQGDLQQPLILAVLGQRLLLWRAEAERGGDEPPVWLPAMAALRIADVTGIPRETVRRKLSQLEARGWVERTAEGAWTVAIRNGEAPARAALGALDARGIERAARLFVALGKIVSGEGLLPTVAPASRRSPERP